MVNDRAIFRNGPSSGNITEADEGGLARCFGVAYPMTFGPPAGVGPVPPFAASRPDAIDGPKSS